MRIARNAEEPRFRSGLFYVYVWRTFCITHVTTYTSEDRGTTAAEARS